MRAPLPHLTALALGVAAALAIGCGGSNLIPADRAGSLKDALARVQTAVDSGDCGAARSAFEDAVSVNQQLPASVDPRLRARLLQGLTSLGRHLAADCLQARIPTVTTETTPTPTTSTETITAATTETQTTQTETTATPTTTAPAGTTQATTPAGTTPTTPPDTGGQSGEVTAAP